MIVYIYKLFLVFVIIESLDKIGENMADWSDLLSEEKDKSYFKEIIKFLLVEREQGKIIYPAKENMFQAFSLTNPESLKVVILGQDPYHGPGQAHGLSFSVPKGVRLPPSLRNIYKEIEVDCNVKMPEHGDLTSWAEQGVLLLNSVLSVESGKAGSHAKLGWEKFTDLVIQKVSEHCNSLVFLLWGAYAHKKSAIIDREKHLILTAPHPSPLSAHRGFLTCRHFSKANQFIEKKRLKKISWDEL